MINSETTEGAISSASLQFLQRVFDITHIGIFSIDENLNFVYVNKHFCSLLGYAADDFLRIKYLDLINPADRAKSLKNIATAMNSGVVIDTSRVFIKSNGEAITCHVRCSKYCDQNGMFTGVVGTITDITNVISAETELRIASVAFESQVATMITDKKGIILRVNEAFSETTGYSSSEAIGQKSSLLNSGKHDKSFYNKMWSDIVCGGVWKGRIFNKKKSGEVYEEWLVISSVVNKENEITHFVANFRDITFHREAEEKIKNLAFYDTLTCLPNRRLLSDRLGRALNISERAGSYGAVVFVDLDNFKKLNDGSGYCIGDKVLVEVAERLVGCVRDSDTVSRIGGDEFVLVVEHLGETEDDAIKNIGKLCSKILEQLRHTHYLEDGNYVCTSSVGVSLFFGKSKSADLLMQQADIAMYEAKSLGKNTVCFFDPETQRRAQEKLSIEADLRRATIFDEWDIYYQVQVDSVGNPIGAEALVRWIHPEKGVILPGCFIDVAEETGLILPIGGKVLELACRQLFLWKNNPRTEGLVLSVNVSARQFRNPYFVDEVRAQLAHFNVPRNRLKLELTESLFVSNVDDAVAKMEAIASLGVSFSLDDFGTGYSSLSYLKRLPFDQIKIDRSFVHDMLDDPNDAAIAKAVIDLGKSLGFQVIAEGVETQEQVDFLIENGCSRFQGYLFGKPMPSIDFEQAIYENI